MKRAIWITGAFVVIELLLDVVVHFARLHYGPRSMRWIDMVVLPLLGVLIVLVARQGALIALASGAVVGIADSSLGVLIALALGDIQGSTMQYSIAYGISAVFIHPVELAVYALAGGAVGLGIPFVLDKSHASA